MWLVRSNPKLNNNKDTCDGIEVLDELGSRCFILLFSVLVPSALETMDDVRGLILS